MTKLDEALVDLRQDINDAKNQMAFYDLFLNSTFLVPILEQSDIIETPGQEPARDVLPVVLQSEGFDYLMLFSSPERLKAWHQKEEEIPYIQMAGHQLALVSQDPLHWALDVGSDYSKQFHPSEISWLRDAVERCNADAAAKAAK